MRKVIEALEQNELRDKVKIMVGGAPVNETYSKQIGADGYAMDAGGSVEVARKLLN